MAEAKFKPTGQSVDNLLDGVSNEKMRDDCHQIVRLMRKITGEEPVVWHPNIIGFGKYHYVYDSGREGDGVLAAFAVRSPNINVYLMDFPERDELLKKLGKHKATKGCVYIKKLEDVDVKVLEKMISRSVAFVKKQYPD